MPTAPKYFIRQYHGLSFNHGGQGYTDAETVLLREGYVPLELPFGNDTRLLRKPARLLALLRLGARVKPGDEIVFLHPVFAGLYRLLVQLLVKRRARLICVIGDITGIKFNQPDVLEKEIRLFRSMKYFVVHNPAMEAWLLSVHPEAKCSQLHYFDFLVHPPALKRTRTDTAVFAGNLEKSGFLQRLGELYKVGYPVQMNLYGPGLSPGTRLPEAVNWKGEFTPAQLPGLLEGSFGLIWDGDGLAGPEGDIGHYIALITQHKLSLYILAGLPVIIHRLTASASLVEKEGIGIVIDSLYELPGCLAAVTEDDYQQMRARMELLKPRISEGGNLPDALKKLSH